MSDESKKEEARKALAALDEQRKVLEVEAAAITDELLATPPDGGEPMGIDTPLVDRDGYPRGDIDVYRARTLRGRLAAIKTDHSNLMRQLSQGLVTASDSEKEDQAEMAARRAPKPKPKLDPVTGKWVVKNWDGTVSGIKGGHERSFDNLEQESNTSVSEAQSAMSATRISQVTTPPFCKVNAVAANSPAAIAGLLEGDLVIQFGTVNHTNHRDLAAIGELVPAAAADQQGIPITVQQPGAPARSVTLVPRPWEGRGLLGCHIIKYSSDESS